MEIFGNKKKRKVYRRAPKTLKQILTDRFTRIVQHNPDLADRLAFKEMGHEDLLPDEVLKTQKEIEKHITEQALEAIKNDKNLANIFIQEKIEQIISGSNPQQAPTRRGRKSKYAIEDDEDDFEELSSIDQAINEMSSIKVLKEKLSELGFITEEGGKGFLSGLTLKDILEVLPVVSKALGGGNGGNGTRQLPPSRTYVVSINGKNVELNELQYQAYKSNQLNLAAPNPRPQPSPNDAPANEPPITIISDSAAPPTKQGNTEPQQAVTQAPAIDANQIINNVDFEILMEWFNSEPAMLVKELSRLTSEGNEIGLLYGFLSEMNYEAVCILLEKYAEKEEIRLLLEKLRTEEGQRWLEEVIQLIKEDKAKNGK